MVCPDTVLRWHRDVVARPAVPAPAPVPVAHRALDSRPGVATGPRESRMGYRRVRRSAPPNPSCALRPGHGGRPCHAGVLGRVPRLVRCLARAAVRGGLGRSAAAGTPHWAPCCGPGWSALPCCSTSPGASTHCAMWSAPARSPPAATTGPPTCGRRPCSHSAKAGTTCTIPTRPAPAMAPIPVRSKSPT